jgi:hypothetical protein
VNRSARAAPGPRREPGSAEEPVAPSTWPRLYGLVIGLLALEIVLLALVSASFRR